MSAFRAALAPYGVHPRQFAVLRALSTADGSSQQQLSQALYIPASKLVALIDDLEERGLLERRPHPSDRRTRSLHLTNSGHDILAELLDATAEHEKRLFAGLSTLERAQFDQLLLRVASSLGLEPGEHPGMRTGPS